MAWFFWFVAIHVTIRRNLAPPQCQTCIWKPSYGIAPTPYQIEPLIFCGSSLAMHETNILEDEESKTNTQTISYLAATSKESGTETLPNLNLTQQRYGD